MDDDTTGVAGISTGMACPFGNLRRSWRTVALGEGGTLLGAAQIAGCCAEAGPTPPTFTAVALPISTAPRDCVTDGPAVMTGVGVEMTELDCCPASAAEDTFRERRRVTPSPLSGSSSTTSNTLAEVREAGQVVVAV